MAYASERSRGYPRARGHNPLFGPFLLFVALIMIAAAYVGYVLWPRWPGGPVSLQAPALPIVIGGTMFNVEPAAIRRAVQRKAGAQERIDLAYLWPSLAPPDGSAPDAEHPIDPNERLFVTIADGAVGSRRRGVSRRSIRAISPAPQASLRKVGACARFATARPIKAKI